MVLVLRRGIIIRQSNRRFQRRWLDVHYWSRNRKANVPKMTWWSMGISKVTLVARKVSFVDCRLSKASSAVYFTSNRPTKWYSRPHLRLVLRLVKTAVAALYSVLAAKAGSKKEKEAQ